MSARDLATLLDSASADLPELDFAEAAWADALAARVRRRRRVLGTVGTVALAGAVAVAVQLGASTTPRPAPTPPSPTTTGLRHLPDGTAYAVMPMEGKEAELPAFDAKLPSTIDVKAPAERLSSLTSPPDSVVAVYLREVGAGYQPVLVTGDGRSVLVDEVRLAPTSDGAKPGVPLGVRAFDGDGYVVFPQPRAVVLLDVRSGQVRRFTVPSSSVVDAAWSPDQRSILARSPSGVWALDPWSPDPVRARPVDAASYAGQFRLSATAGPPSRVAVSWTRATGAPTGSAVMTAPVVGTWGDTVNTDEWAAAGAFFDQNAVHSVIRLGNGPIYQGLVAAPADGQGGPRLLLAPESPDGQTGRFNECCSVLSWADGNTVLFRTYGSHGVWVLAWNVRTGNVYEVSRLGPLSGTDVPMPIALNVGWRY